MASKAGDYSGPGRSVCRIWTAAPTVVPISARTRRYFRPESATIQLILANFLTIYANDGYAIAVGRAPRRVMVNIADADLSPVTNHRFKFCQQYFAQMTATPAINNNFCFAVQVISITGARFLIAARLPHPAPTPTPAPVTALQSPN
jgi:hypothetical protein